MAKKALLSFRNMAGYLYNKINLRINKIIKNKTNKIVIPIPLENKEKIKKETPVIINNNTDIKRKIKNLKIIIGLVYSLLYSTNFNFFLFTISPIKPYLMDKIPEPITKLKTKNNKPKKTKEKIFSEINLPKKGRALYNLS